MVVVNYFSFDILTWATTSQSQIDEVYTATATVSPPKKQIFIFRNSFCIHLVSVFDQTSLSPQTNYQTQIFYDIFVVVIAAPHFVVVQ